MSYSLSDIENKKREIEEAKNILFNNNDPNYMSLNSKQKNAYNNNLLKIVNKKIRELDRIERRIYNDMHSLLRKQNKKDILINDEIRTCKHTIKDNKIYYLNDWGCLATAPLNILLDVN
jgi:hypothetical protein